MKIAIVEDENIFAEKLSCCVKNFLGHKKMNAELSKFESGESLINIYKSGGNFDLIFLDIQLKDSDGMEIGKELRKYDENAGIIFVTGLENRAAEGYAVEAFDYIVKSCLDEKLESVLERYLKRICEGVLTLTTENGLTIIPFREIYAAESQGRTSLLHTASGTVNANTAVGKIAEKLPREHYFEIYKGIYVRVKEIRSVDSDRLIMRSGSVFPVSRRRRKPLLKEILRAN